MQKQAEALLDRYAAEVHSAHRHLKRAAMCLATAADIQAQIKALPVYAMLSPENIAKIDAETAGAEQLAAWFRSLNDFMK